jgi:dockerin type I repeat protein
VILVDQGEGVNGSDRVTLVWGSLAVTEGWLCVRVLPTERTGLPAADVFAFGSLPGDVNGDGAVSDADYTLWADHYGQTDTTSTQVGDLNLDGRVSDADYTAWAENYGASLAAPPAMDVSVSQAEALGVEEVGFGILAPLASFVASEDESVSDADGTLAVDDAKATGAAWPVDDAEDAIGEIDYALGAGDLRLEANVAGLTVQTRSASSAASRPRRARAHASAGVGVMKPASNPLRLRTRPSEYTLRDDAIWVEDGEGEIADVFAILSAPESL